MNLKRIVAAWLRAQGFDGLVARDGSCGCAMKDLMPCSSPGADCEPAYKHCDSRPGKNPEAWAMFAQKEPPTKEQWDATGF
jgi:hypothetical protein